MKQADPPEHSNPNPAETQVDSRAASPRDPDLTLHSSAAAPLAEGQPAEAPQSIGAYKLIRRLGEGGMGQVWLAEQTAPVKRQVALKLIKGGLYDNAVMQRFESERQSLAVMNHPAIAKVFDAGSTRDGAPYFVMEYVNGLPITRYCDGKKLRLRDRIALFIKVCEGVQHAHQKAIIHRDLKPSNVLVEEVDGKPVPRIIDFGIAKAISSQPGADQTIFTQVGALIGTPGFMSPEQADPGVLDVDTRTDVYSLGMILYVLLAGTLPFDLEQMKKKPLDQVLRQLREDDPISPSTKLALEKETSAATAENRGMQAKQLMHLLRGDLDWITLRAIEKDRARRYGTPSELAADLQRYLENKPVVARPATTGYRLRKYVRRHVAGVSVAAALILLLAGFAIVQAVELRRITRERDRANRVTDFMTNMFKVSDPSEARGNTITARELLDKAFKDIDTGLAKDPELQAQMLYAMGGVYENLGLYQRSQSLHQKALDVRTLTLGARNPTTLQSSSALGAIMRKNGDFPDSEKLLRQTLESQQRELGLENPDTLATMHRLANVLLSEGNYPEAEKLGKQVLELRRKILGPDNSDTLGSMNNLAINYIQESRYDDALQLFTQVLEARRRTLGTDHPDTLASMSNLAGLLSIGQRYAEAEKLNRESVEVERRVSGPDHPDTLAAVQNLSLTLNNEGKFAEAEQLERDVIEGEKKVLGPDNPQTLHSYINLADTLFSEQKYAEAEQVSREAYEANVRVLGPNHPQTAISAFNLGQTLLHRGRQDEAYPLLLQGVDHGPLRMIAKVDQDDRLKTALPPARFATLAAHAQDRLKQAAAVHQAK